ARAPATAGPLIGGSEVAARVWTVAAAVPASAQHAMAATILLRRRIRSTVPVVAAGRGRGRGRRGPAYAAAVAPRRMTGRQLESRVRAICTALPEVTEKVSHGAPTFFVRKSFVMLWADGHHGNGFPHLWAAAPPGVQAEVVEAEPA